MNKTVNISLNGIHFNIDENAYQKLKKYLDQLEYSLRNEEGRNEIMQDIETRISELFTQYLGIGRDVVSEQDVDRVISVMGEPKDYVDTEENEEPQSSSEAEHSSYSSENGGEYYTYTNAKGEEKTILKKLYRDLDERIIGGVLAGISHYFSWQPLYLRIAIGALLCLSLFTDFGISAMFWIISYILLWIIIPPATTNIEKLQMYGEPVNVDSIKKSVNKSELGDAADRLSGFTKEIVEDAGPYVESLAKTLWKIFKGVLGIILIIMGIGVMISGVTFLITSLATNKTIFDFSNIIFDHQWQFYLFVFFMFLMLISLSILLIYGGVRLLSHQSKKVNSAPWLLSCLTLFITGLVGSSILGFNVGRNFSDEVTYFDKNKLNIESDTLKVRFSNKNQHVYKYRNRGFSSSFGVNATKDSILIQVDKDIKIKKSYDHHFYLEVAYSARGNSEEHAADEIDRITYRFEVDKNVLNLEEQLKIPIHSKFRDQEVELTLYIPEKKYVIFENTDDINASGFLGVDRLFNQEDYTPTLYSDKDSLKCINCGGYSSNPNIDVFIDDDDFIKVDQDSVLIRSGKNVIRANKDSMVIKNEEGNIDIKIKDK